MKAAAVNQSDILVPDAPPRAQLLSFQIALVELLRCELLLRSLEQGTDEPEARTLSGRRDEIANALARLRAEHTFPFDTLCASLELDDVDRQALLIIAAPHFVPDIRGAFALFRDGNPRPPVTAALIAEVLSNSAVNALEVRQRFRPGGRLVRAGLIELAPPSLPYTASLMEYELVPTSRLLGVLRGVLQFDSRLSRMATLYVADDDDARGVWSQAEATAMFQLVQASAQAHATRDRGTALFSGAASVGKLRLSSALAASLGHRYVLAVESAFLPHTPELLCDILELIERESTIWNALPVLNRVENFVSSRALATTLRAALSRFANPIVLTTDMDVDRDDADLLHHLTTLRFLVHPPGPTLRAQSWSAELADQNQSPVDDGDITRLASDFPLTRNEVARAVSIGASTPDSTEEASVLAYRKAAESLVHSQLRRYATRSTSTAGIDQLVLAETTMTEVKEVINAVRYRVDVMERWGFAKRLSTGRGIVALFNGLPGTGKTFTANVMANELNMPMYRIDVSSIVDRFVGETEKNLTRVFEEAQSDHALLLFDEADSLFAKRVQAKDSVDRFANMQVNLLLNLVEDYDGFVVLTTNLKSGLDAAFLRRIAFKIPFTLPEYEERLALWRIHLPDEVPKAPDLNLENLAETFDRISGGEVKNAVLRAALMARGEQPITQAMLERAALSELQSAGSVIQDRGPAETSGKRASTLY